MIQITVRQAIEKLSKLDYSIIATADIILMDIFMGGIDGFETSKRAGWIFKNLKMIAITMNIEKMFLDKILESGFKGCVYKGDISENIENAINAVDSGQFFVLKSIPVTKQKI